MIGDFMSLGEYAPHQAGIPDRRCANYKERGSNTGRRQHIQHPWRVIWIWSIIES